MCVCLCGFVPPHLEAKCEEQMTLLWVKENIIENNKNRSTV